ncbi:transmembrane domain protein, partial [Vibrio parahaemolyticus V-223/04]
HLLWRLACKPVHSVMAEATGLRYQPGHCYW